MVEFSNYKVLERWLKDKPRDWTVMLAVRAALRSVPAYSSLIETESIPEYKRLNIVLPVLRAMAAIWAAAEYPAHTKELHTATNFALSALVDGIKYVKGTTTVAYAAANAGSAAITGSTTTAATVMLDVTYNVGSASAVTDLWRALSSDAQALEGGTAPQVLAGKKLWPGKRPQWLSDQWSNLRKALLNSDDPELVEEDWAVWTTWYQARLDGTVPKFKDINWSGEIEIARVLEVTEGEWRDGPKVANAKLREIMERLGGVEEEPRLELPIGSGPYPRADIVELVKFAWSTNGKIALSGISPLPAIFPLATSKEDHRERLESARHLAQRTIELLSSQRYEGQSDFLESFRHYVDQLPEKAEENTNLFEADNEARFIRDLFAAEHSTLGNTLRSRLKIFLEVHQGLRVFYPKLSQFYSDVRNGRITEPLPIDAVRDFQSGLQENTPDIVEPEVTESFQRAENITVKSDVEEEKTEDNTAAEGPMPPPDPLGEIDQAKAGDVATASKANSIWKTIVDKTGEANKLTDNAQKLYHRLKGPVGKILEWWDKFGGGGGGGPSIPA